MYRLRCTACSPSQPYIYILIPYSGTGWLCHSVCLSVRYRNHFAVVQFQNQAHIWNPYDPAEVFKTMGAAGTP